MSSVQNSNQLQRKKSKIEAISTPVISWLNYNKLYTTTPIGGFGFISQSKFSWETIIWYIIIIVFTGFTIQNVKECVVEYLDEPTLTTVKLIETTVDKGQLYLSLDEVMYFHFPVASVLMDQVMADFDFKAYNLTKAQMTYIAKESANTVYDLEWADERFDPLKKYVRTELKKSLEKLKTKEDIIQGQWDPSLLFPMSLMHEFSRDNGRTFREWHNSPNVCQKTLQQHLLLPDGYNGNTDLYCSIFSILDNLNISGDDYYDKLYTELSRFYNFEYSVSTPKKLKKGQIKHECELNVKNPSVCGVTFALDEMNLKTRIGFRLKFDGNRYDYLELNWPDYQGTLTFLDREFIRERKKIHGWVEHGTHQVYYQNIKEVFNSSIECHKQGSAEDCKLACKREATFKACSCVGIRGNYLYTPRQPLCSLSMWKSNYSLVIDNHYYYFNKEQHYTNFSNKALKECEQKCNSLPVCHRRFSEYKQKDRQRKACDFCEFLDLHITTRTPNDYVYKQFETDYKTSWSGLMAEVGGTFDLWIGISLIALIHLLVYTVKQLIYVWNNRTKAGQKLRSMLNDFRPTALVIPAAVELQEPENKVDEPDLVKICNELTEKYDQMTKTLAETNEKYEKMFDQLKERLDKLGMMIGKFEIHPAKTDSVEK